MFDLSLDISEAKQQLAGWRSSKTAKEYPHSIVRAILVRAHSTKKLWDEYINGKLSDIGGIMACHNLEKRYTTLSLGVNSQIDNWIDTNRSVFVGGAQFSTLDALATNAEYGNNSILEAVEYTFISHFLMDKCILYWIAMRLCGLSEEDAFEEVSGVKKKINCEITYDVLKIQFQNANIKQYVQANIVTSNENTAFGFEGDKFSKPTPDFCKLLTKAPNLLSYISQQTEQIDFIKLLRAYEVDLYHQGIFSYDIKNLVDEIRSNKQTIDNTLQNFSLIEHSKAVDDQSDLSSFAESFGKMSDSELVRKFSIYDHPYVCTKLANYFLLQETPKFEGYVFLQKALNYAFSYPNPFWDSAIAMCGCCDALLLLSNIIPKSIYEPLEKQFGFSIFKCVYLFLNRTILLCNDIERDDLMKKYTLEIAQLICKSKSELVADGVQEECLQIYDIFAKSGFYSTCTQGQIFLAELMMSQIKFECYERYNHGQYRISESTIADIVQYLQIHPQGDVELDFYLDSEKYRVVDLGSSSEEIRGWKKAFTETENREITIATLKDSVSKFREFFKEHNITELYHFTDRKNLESIRKYGLLSLRYIKNNGIITYSGGNEETQKIDASYDLDDYIRLSFHHHHPMGWRLKSEDHRHFIILKIKSEVAFSEGTLFSDINAIHPNHHHGGDINSLQAVNMDAVNEPYSKAENYRHEQMAAEVMVKTNIPVSYILNLDDPESF